VAVATASASAANSTTADAVAGAHTHSHHKAGKGKSNFSDTLDAILSAQGAQPQAAITQDNIPAHKHAAMARAAEALQASTAADGDTTDDSPDAISALAAKMAGITNATTADNATNSGTAAGTSTSQATSDQTVQKGGGRHAGGKHDALTAASQARLVAALAQAANAPAKIVGSDGQTAASSDSKGTPATDVAQPSQPQPAQSETAAETANVLAAMQTGQSVVTTVEPNANKTEATVTPHTMTQLEKAALGNTAQQALHSAAPAAKTEAQALQMPADAKSASPQDGNSSGTQTGADQNQSQNSDTARLAAAAAKSSDAQPQSKSVPDAPKQAANPTAATQAAANTAIANAASTVGGGAAAQATPPTTVATTLQVAQQASASSPATPDLSALAVSIAAKAKDGQNEFNIRMEPAELGRVDVRISVDAAGKAQAHLTADKPQTLQMLQRDSQTLERSLKDSGLNLSNNGLNFSLKGEQQSSTPTFIARNRALSINSVQTTDIVSSTSGTSTAPGDSRLDIRV
jgi:flagellar hook-length control protein FliK